MRVYVSHDLQIKAREKVEKEISAIHNTLQQYRISKVSSRHF